MAHKINANICNVDDLLKEVDLIKTNWLPICVGGIQWYVSEISTFDNINAVESSITKIYKQGANGTISMVAPVGVIQEGYCNAGSGGTLYTTGLSTQFLNSAFTVPTAPVNTKEVVIYNLTNAVIQYTTNKGTQSVPPSGVLEFKVNDYETGITFSSVSLLSGTFNSGEYTVINYKTSI